MGTIEAIRLPNRYSLNHGIFSDGGAMTVLHIFSGDLWAGAEVMVFHLLNALQREPGMKIIALSLNDGTLARKLQDAKIETYVIPEADHSFVGIVLNAYRILKGRRIDAIHSHRNKENLLASLLARLIGTKRLVSTLHGLPETPLRAKKGGKGISVKAKVDYFLLRHLFSDIVAVSQEMKEVLAQKYRFKPEKIDVIYNGIPTLPAGVVSPGNTVADLFHIGTVGRMVPVKDFDLFLRVAAEIRKETHRVRFSILGDGPLKESLIRKVEELNLNGEVEFLAPMVDPGPYYRSLDLYLNTSLHEGIPLSILEAMASGRPVVAPRVGGIPEIITHAESGFLIEGRNPNAFARCCLRLQNENKLRAEIGGNASNRVLACFSETKMAGAYRELYQGARVVCSV